MYIGTRVASVVGGSVSGGVLVVVLVVAASVVVALVWRKKHSQPQSEAHKEGDSAHGDLDIY